MPYAIYSNATFAKKGTIEKRAKNLGSNFHISLSTAVNNNYGRMFVVIIVLGDYIHNLFVSSY